jgi:hypothetical protein
VGLRSRHGEQLGGEIAIQGRCHVARLGPVDRGLRYELQRDGGAHVRIKQELRGGAVAINRPRRRTNLHLSDHPLPHVWRGVATFEAFGTCPSDSREPEIEAEQRWPTTRPVSKRVMAK